MEHYRPSGHLEQGYFCCRCGAAGINMYGTGHGEGLCEHNQKLVGQLHRANPRSPEKPRFIRTGVAE